ncbi:pilus assembly protein TadG-related protein [Aestuariivirga sp.]|uniref:vWA domain-containing protein n=1 Tax=Aestuariivirga sp. TaxID=2650926 RepID=UPI003593D9D0
MMKTLKSLFRSESGQLSVMFALSAVPLLIAIGSAVDYVRIYDTRTKLQAAVDGAALAAAMAEDRNDGQRWVMAKNYFKSNFSAAHDSEITIDVKVTTKRVAVTVNYEQPTSLLALAGIKSTEISVTGEVLRAGESWAEVVMVLDYSGSMKDNDKYKRMAEAATTMVDSLSSSIEEGHLKIGLVPFSAMVHTSMPSSYVTQWSADSTWTGCTQDRKYPYNTTVDTPVSGNSDTKWGYYDNTSENSGSYACSAYQSKNLKILPLTNDMEAVKAKLDGMRPLGNTNIPLGAAFGWNLLDPAAPYTEAVPYTDKKTHKYLILLTDGVQTSKQWGSGNSRSVQKGNENLVKICAGMANAGITVFTVAYDITDPKVTTLLKNCGGERYYEPDVSSSGITEVFAAITEEINKQIIRLAR